MSKKLLAAGALLGLFSHGAIAQTAFVDWRNGTAVVRAASNICKQNGVNIGDVYNARYRHPGIGDNGERARVSLFSRRSAHNFQMTGDFSNAFEQVFSAAFIGGGLTTQNSTPDPYTPSIRMTTRLPKTIDATTTQVYLYLKIQNFFVNTGITGCNIDLEITAVQ